MRDSTKPSFRKKIGIWHRKSVRSIPLSGKGQQSRSCTHPVRHSEMPMLRKEYVRQYRQGSQQGQETRYYYYCKNTVTPTGHECSFRLNIEQTEINKFVAKIISAMVNNPRFVEAIQAKIGSAVDTEDMEKQIAVLQGQLKQAFGTKSRWSVRWTPWTSTMPTMTEDFGLAAPL